MNPWKGADAIGRKSQRVIRTICGAHTLPERDLDRRIDEREEWNSRDEEKSYSLRDEGRNPDGSGESYAERNQ